MINYDAMVQTINARIDIATFIGAHVHLRKRGTSLVGLCPFHRERTASFHVRSESATFECFGCGARGDLADFVSRLQSLSRINAIRSLAETTGLDPDAQAEPSGHGAAEREAIYRVNRIAAAFFERMLHHPQGAAARAYCQARRLSQATISGFHLGFAPDSWNALVLEIQRLGLDLELAAKACLVKRSERGYYDFYRNRLLIPMYDTQGDIIAFGGRALGDAEPKYLNTSTTPVYSKGQHLYARNLIHDAAARDGTVILVEGYLDCIALHQADFTNTVATLGTAFTTQQARELFANAKTVFVCFDGDNAGKAATRKAIDTAATVVGNAGLAMHVVTLPANCDPDTFIHEHGAAAFRDRLASSQYAIEFVLEQESARLRDAPSAGEIVSRVETAVRRLTPQAEWDRWRMHVATHLHRREY